MIIPNEAVQKYFDEESSKLLNKQISILREFHIGSEEDTTLFNDFVKFCEIGSSIVPQTSKTIANDRNI